MGLFKKKKPPVSSPQKTEPAVKPQQGEDILDKAMQGYENARQTMLSRVNHMLENDIDADSVNKLFNDFSTIQQALINVLKAADEDTEIYAWDKRHFDEFSKISNNMTDVINNDDSTGDDIARAIVYALDDLQEVLSKEPPKISKDASDIEIQWQKKKEKIVYLIGDSIQNGTEGGVANTRNAIKDAMRLVFSLYKSDDDQKQKWQDIMSRLVAVDDKIDGFFEECDNDPIKVGELHGQEVFTTLISLAEFLEAI